MAVPPMSLVPPSPALLGYNALHLLNLPFPSLVLVDLTSVVTLLSSMGRSCAFVLVLVMCCSAAACPPVWKQDHFGPTLSAVKSGRA
ncbi:hypothetical protein DFH29DRAFT_939134 [Suillus ampliporus]|nr:hypothetical protein DFH29DRAFT_939134 [Suillus ampliporus]